MGKRALEAKRITRRTIRANRLSDAERQTLRAGARYEGSPYHKRDPWSFGLQPLIDSRPPDKTLCDEAGVLTPEVARTLFDQALEHGLVSQATTYDGWPKQIWVVDERGQVFEAMYGGSGPGRYHGYPVRKTNPLFDEVLKAWNRA